MSVNKLKSSTFTRQEYRNVGAQAAPSPTSPTSPTSLKSLTSLRINNDESKKTIVRKVVRRVTTRKDEHGIKEDDVSNRVDDGEDGSGDRCIGGSGTTPVVKKIIRRKKKPAQLISQANLSNNGESDGDPEGDGNGDGRGGGVDTENEILNSIIEKKIPHATDQEKGTKKKKKILVKKMLISEKSKLPVRSNVVGIGGGSTVGGELGTEGEMEKEKMEKLRHSHEEEVIKLKEERKEEEEKLNTYIHNLNMEMYNLNNRIKDEVVEKEKLQLLIADLNDTKSCLEKKVLTLETKIEETTEMYNLLKEKVITLEEENKLLLQRDEEKGERVTILEDEKIKLEKKMEEKMEEKIIALKRKDEMITKYIKEIENYKNVLKNKGEMMMLMNSSSTIDKNSPEKNNHKEYINKLVKEKKELIYAFKKQLDLIIILKKQINLLENNKILNITSSEFKRILQD
ncbi:conserved Plasmodium protein, unknown function [Plasmodium ovale]|uniref:Uncharacterized protein n=1 Tax=Plasmodium ovale TaxID=36330 RepID=A0A1D3KX70_PLAOA|nr:conserved Plasmodium protein, unknown function [Plasmodium ovale]